MFAVAGRVYPPDRQGALELLLRAAQWKINAYVIASAQGGLHESGRPHSATV